MKKVLTVVCGLALLLCVTPNAVADIVTNGSFEVPVIGGGTFGIFGSIPGWTTAYGCGIELQNHVAGTPFAGNEFVELDSNCSSGMYQNLATTAGTTYTLSFAFSPRAGTSAADNVLRVMWNGSALTTLTASGIGNSDTKWTVYNYQVTATNSLTRLEFDDLGVSNSLGTYVDAVSVNSVPEPSSLMLLGTGLFAVGRLVRKKYRA